MKHFRSGLLSSVFCFILFVLLSFAYLYRLYFFTPWLEKKRPRTLILQKGPVSRQLIAGLIKYRNVKYPFLFRKMLGYRLFRYSLQSGEYRLLPGMSLNKLLLNMHQGRVFIRKLRIKEGSTYREILGAVYESAGLLPTYQLWNQKLLLTILKADIDQNNIAGWVFPSTYYYVRGDAALDLLRRAVRRMQLELKREWKSRKLSLHLSSQYSALIIASIVEREAQLDSERPIIAAVILNRLHKGMRLQMDPTVLYGLYRRYNKKVLPSMLKIDTPYNTYLHLGLPPTPICMPSLSSIRAVMHPSDTDDLFFVAKGDGSHIFSKYYVDHVNAIRLIKQRKMDVLTKTINASKLDPVIDKKGSVRDK